MLDEYIDSDSDELVAISIPHDRPVICTISGNGGVGKTSLAATFPNPVFICAEDGLQAIPIAVRPPAFPVLKTAGELWEQLNTVLRGKHKYETLVIDSITQLDTLFQKHIISSDQKKPASINQALGGYGAGYSALSGMHGRVRAAAEMINERGMHVVFIAHADTETLDLPDQDAFSVYTIRIHKKSVQHYIDNVDMVAFVKLETFTLGEEGERKKAISDGSRIVTCHATASSCAKNRYDINEDLAFDPGKNPFVGLIPSLGGPHE